VAYDAKKWSENRRAHFESDREYAAAAKEAGEDRRMKENELAEQREKVVRVADGQREQIADQQRR